ncbi:nitroimidazol reductase NimA-like FMN-containing flavoprotein (pyridoxamine 5'-phosphate oxidase superfamily) [Nocardia transvalensis]|uniref:Nitroimidazol reductase NimA-like FMN-containing flavoprotein (Pyridoxamine 5'-phosphate oxidase superfamily) n=1 Tax=Nocardia transvalensis TaxID=37333 RepID=A0A7W9PGA4_9NOCA|nr:pyridoxamine 5'-phosphate oxidase family protein [Nocardia transvalensis]MBB5915639.1 nitroimidazol reductase NimA-like FMN-containing flavoprotein (pyridoxamine 5'-phosphate oxidase superfamily) [Nocardia transvalensis]
MVGSRELSVTQSLELLGSVRFGRVVFSRYALPTIRPVNHAVVDETIVIYANPGTTLSADRQVVAYEADTIDHATLRGWCVIVTGAAEELTDPDDIAQCRELLPAALPGPRDRMIRIYPDIVTGVEYLVSSAVDDSDTVRQPPG